MYIRTTSKFEDFPNCHALWSYLENSKTIRTIKKKNIPNAQVSEEELNFWWVITSGAALEQLLLPRVYFYHLTGKSLLALTSGV
jgi:hypothetical protein